MDIENNEHNKIRKYKVYDVVSVCENKSCFEGIIKLITEKGLLITIIEPCFVSGFRRKKQKFIKWCNVLENRGYYKKYTYK